MTLKEFMEDYKGFEFRKGTIVLVKDNRPIIVDEFLLNAIYIVKYGKMHVRDWTHTDNVMAITLSE